jgi:hypothetical protein
MRAPFALLVLSALAVPALAQPVMSPAERTYRENNRSLLEQNRSLTETQRNQFETNALRNEIQRRDFYNRPTTGANCPTGAPC